MFKAHRLLYHPTLGLRVIKKKKKVHHQPSEWDQIVVFETPGLYCSSGMRARVRGQLSRLIDSCITQLKAQGPSRTCNESKEEEEEEARVRGQLSRSRSTRQREFIDYKTSMVTD